MKFRKGSILLSSAILLGSVAAGLPNIAQAADADQALTGTATTNQENGAEQGVDPANIATDATSGTADSFAGIGFKAGNLTLNQVPNFDFGGSNEFMTKTDFTLFSAGADLPYTTEDAAATKTRPRALIVTDARGAATATDEESGTTTNTTTGWKVAVKFATLMKNAAGTELGTTGAATAAPILQLSNTLEPTAVTYDSANSGSITPGSTISDPTSPLYTGTAPSFGADGSKTGFIDVPSNKAESTTIVNAKAGSGLRGWAVNYQDQDSAHLVVPVEQQSIGVFTATLNWTLGNAPE